MGSENPPETKYKHYDSLPWAVFNCRLEDQIEGRKAVLAEFGEAGCAVVKSKMRTGIMELFHHKPTPETKCYANAVAKSADDNYEKRYGQPRL